MKPETATKLAAMGDIKANKEKLRVALEEAKKNPEAPQSVELRRRLERGMFNAELQALGKKPFPVQVPKVDMGKALAGATQGQQSVVKEPAIVESLMDLGEGVVEGAKTFMQGGREIVDTATRDDRTLAEKATMIGGKAFQYGSAGVGELVLGAIKAVPGVTPEVEQATADLVQKAVSGVAETEIVQDYSNWYNSLDERSRDQVNAAGGFAAGLIDLLGIKAGETGARVLKEGVEASVPVVKQGIEATGEALQEGMRTTTGVIQRAVTPSPEEASRRINDAVRAIVQPTGKTATDRADEIASARRVLTEINPDEIKDYASLQNKLDNQVKTLADAQNQHLAQFTERYTSDKLGVYQKVGDETVVSSPVQDALNGLEQAYRMSGDVAGEAKIRQLRTQMETKGLTVSDINQLARDYNVEFRARAFDKIGNPKQGFNAENYETVRKGIKQVARDRMPDDISRELDAQLSDVYETRRMVDRMNVAVERALDKAPKTGPMRKAINTIVGGAFGLTDTITGNVMSNLVKAIASRAGVAQRTSLTALELQEQLAKNLAQIEKLNKIQDPDAFAKAFEKYLNEDVAVGLSIKSTVTPESVASKVDAEDLVILQKYLDKPSDIDAYTEAQLLFEKIGIDKADDPTQRRFVGEVTDIAKANQTSQ